MITLFIVPQYNKNANIISLFLCLISLFLRNDMIAATKKDGRSAHIVVLYRLKQFHLNYTNTQFSPPQIKYIESPFPIALNKSRSVSIRISKNLSNGARLSFLEFKVVE